MDPALPPAAAAPLRAGLLLLDKPIGLSSNRALQVVRRLAGGIKAGHGGSLDPLASGMLPICLGEATRLAGQLLEGRKAYRFGLRLGERSATGDSEGEIIERCAVPALEPERIEAALQRFIGTHAQTPPMYSALKRSGQPLYRLARAGITVERAARNVQIERLQLLAASEAALLLEVVCSKGTYVRVLGEDIAAALGTCGRLESLRRQYVEPFEAQAMVSLETLRALSDAGQPWPLLPADRAVAHLAALTLPDAEALALTQGRSVPLPLVGSVAPPPGRGDAVPVWRLYDSQGRFLGLGCGDGAGQLRSRRLFPAPLLVT
jgi:tRNA pseudouridine55 synthase